MVINTNYLCVNPRNTGCRGRNGVKSDYKWIVVHYVGACNWATGFESTAINNCLYYRDDPRVTTSANFFVDSQGVCMSVPWNSDRYAWHCGTGINGDPNDYLKDKNGVQSNNPNSIGVEICTCKMSTASKDADDNDWYFDPRTYKNAVEFVKQLMAEFNIDEDHVIRHYDANPKRHKPCPSQFVGNDIKKYYGKTGEELWQQFKRDISADTKDICKAFVVTSSDGTLNLRDQASNDGKIIREMKNGDIVLALKEKNGWLYIKNIANGKQYEGWCYGKYLSEVISTQTREVSSPDGSLNIRASASTKGKLITAMQNGYKFVVLSPGKSWGLIQCGETIGYCDITDNYSHLI